MNLKNKRLLVVGLCLVMIFSLSGCGDKKEKTYQNYVKSLIAINYLGATEDYINSTGANKADAEALYNENMEHLANNILAYYHVTISDVSDAKKGYIELAKSIYSKVNYKVSPAKKSGDSYTVDVTIYPINIFTQTHDQVLAYVEKFNTEVANGAYNDYTLEQYESTFSDGLLTILNDGCLNMTYADPVVITVTIIEEGDIYYISDEDFLAIDAAMISTAEPISTASPTDAVQ
ncbi:MAG: hypothetical protein E7258_02910 [Lachnospiraceae bacterium]|nr:hypothetical protein [Lachnospiraceae bacterium]